MSNTEDSPRLQGLRQLLVGVLRQKDIRNQNVLDAIGTIPRHLFMPEGTANLAYDNRAFSIGNEQTISQPYTVAFQSQLLDVSPNDKVLEIGTGSGYQAAVLAHLGAKVHTIERQKKLYEQVQNFSYIHITYPSINYYFGDGFLGLPKKSPFDKILLTASTEEIPHNLFKQLRIGGTMVLPLGLQGQANKMTKITKINLSDFKISNYEEFRFVPMLKGTTSSD